MAEVENYAEIRFTNPIFIDIFSKFADNSVMAGIVSENGEIELRFDNTDVPIGKPSCCEHILSILYALMESNPQTDIGRIYMENQTAILRETVSRLAQLLSGFSMVKLSVFTAEKRTDFTLSQTRTTTKQ